MGDQTNGQIQISIFIYNNNNWKKKVEVNSQSCQHVWVCKDNSGSQSGVRGHPGVLEGFQGVPSKKGNKLFSTPTQSPDWHVWHYSLSFSQSLPHKVLCKPSCLICMITSGLCNGLYTDIWPTLEALRQALQTHCEMYGTKYFGDWASNLERAGTRHGSSIINIPRPHWSKKKKILWTKQKQVVSTVHEGWQGHHLSTNETDRGRQPNTGGEGSIDKLCMLTILPKGHPYNKYSWPKVASVCKHLAGINKLSPTVGTHEENIERVWCQATSAWPTQTHGY